MRENYINWDSYFMGIAILSSMRSKDPNTQVGACIVNDEKRIVGVGYNGLPKGCDDKEFPWERDGEFLNTKYPYVCHAELNAILNSIKSLKDCIIYVALFPCHECTKAIIQSGIKEIVYLSDKYTNTDSNRASKKMLDAAGVKYRRFEPDIEKLEINVVGDFNHGNARIGKQLRRAADEEDFDTEFVQGLGKFDCACLVGQADQGAFDGRHGDSF